MQDNIELQKRISTLSNEGLGQMLLVRAEDYRPEALDIARCEMERRKLTLDALRTIIANPPPPPQPEKSQAIQSPRINGWLIFPAIGFAINPFFILNDLVDTFVPRADLVFTIVIGSVDVVLLVFSCVLAWQFFRRKRNTRFLVMAFYLISLVLSLFCGVFIARYYVVPGFSVWRHVREPLVACVIWIPYFLLSKRVKRTFIIE